MAAPIVSDPTIESIRVLLAQALVGERSDVVVESGLPVPVRVQRRGHRLDIDDAGAAVARAGRPPGWLELAERVAESDALNVNRAGVLFVSSLVGRDVAPLVVRISELSDRLHGELLDLADCAGR